MPGAIAAEFVKAFGGVPATVDASEVYLALQRGTVDGTNFPLTSFYDRKLYETIGHLTITNASFDPDVVVIGSKTWSKLTPDQQAVVKACAAEGEQRMRGEEQRLSAEYIGMLKDKGMNVVQLSPEERAAFTTAAGGIVRDFMEKHGAPARKLVDYIRGP